MFKLREYREANGMTQEAVAEYLGVTRAGYSHLENERRELSLSAACKLADLYGCTLDELAGRVAPQPHTPALLPQTTHHDALAALSADEKAILNDYRETDERGRDTIRAIAANQRKSAPLHATA